MEDDSSNGIPMAESASTTDDSSSEGSGSGSGSESRREMDSMMSYFAHLMHCGRTASGLVEEEPPVRVLSDVTLDAVVDYIRSDRCKNIITLAGAGISTSAGIPDFRSPGSGLYHNLQKYDLPEPQAIFDIRFFMQNPKPFFQLAKELLPGTFKPTPCHYFIKMLHDKGLLLRHYTQNIDTLERVAGLPGDKLVEAHGSFHTSHCVNCNAERVIDWHEYFAVEGDRIPICADCPGVIKPDIVFFGEKLPDRFRDCADEDFEKCDLLIIMGSSLEVQPFASLVDGVSRSCPRLLINRERVGCRSDQLSLLARLAGLTELSPVWKMMPGGLQLDRPDNIRDVAWLGNCDDGCQVLADRLGWGDELREIVKMEHDRIDLEAAAKVASPREPGAVKSPDP